MANNGARDIQPMLGDNEIGVVKLGKLYKLKPDTVRTESVDILDPETGEVLWPRRIVLYTYQYLSWQLLETTPLLLVKMDSADTELAAENGSLREADKEKIEFFFLFHETIICVMLQDETEFLSHFYEVTE